MCFDGKCCKYQHSFFCFNRFFCVSKKNTDFQPRFCRSRFCPFLSSSPENALNTSISAVTLAENAVNSSIFVVDEDDWRTMERKFAARRILSFAGWGGGWGGRGNYVSDRRTFCVTSASERPEHPCPHHDNVRVSSACEWPEHPCPHAENVGVTSACERPERPCPHHDNVRVTSPLPFLEEHSKGNL